MTESESTYYLHTCLSYISIQPLLVFVGTTINDQFLGPALAIMLQNEAEVSNVWFRTNMWLLNHIRAESPGPKKGPAGQS